MATWIAHLRVAENLLNRGLDYQKRAFTVGNIGPDSGVPNENYSNFNPPKKITHWQDDKNHIDPEGFWNKYILNDKFNEDEEYSAFVMGYYYRSSY